MRLHEQFFIRIENFARVWKYVGENFARVWTCVGENFARVWTCVGENFARVWTYVGENFARVDMRRLQSHVSPGMDCDQVTDFSFLNCFNLLFIVTFIY